MGNGRTGRNDMLGMVPVVADAEATASLEDELKSDPDHQAILDGRAGSSLPREPSGILDHPTRFVLGGRT